MKTKRLLICIGILAGIVICFNMIFSLSDAFFYTMEDLPEGQLVKQVPSPSGESTVSVYVVENALGTAVRCSVLGGESEKNIYWQTNEKTAEVYWVDDRSVFINGVTLNVENGTFDSRKINEKLDLFLSNKK